MTPVVIRQPIPYQRATICKNRHIHGSVFQCPECGSGDGSLVSRIIGPTGRLLDGATLTGFQIGTLEYSTCKSTQPVLDWYLGNENSSGGQE